MLRTFVRLQYCCRSVSHSQARIRDYTRDPRWKGPAHMTTSASSACSRSSALRMLEEQPVGNKCATSSMTVMVCRRGQLSGTRSRLLLARPPHHKVGGALDCEGAPCAGWRSWAAARAEPAAARWRSSRSLRRSDTACPVRTLTRGTAQQGRMGRTMCCAAAAPWGVCIASARMVQRRREGGPLS